MTAIKPGLYRATASVPGVRTTVSPSILNFNRRGETKTFTVRFQRTTAAFDEAASGFLTWSGAGTRVRSPIVVTPRAVSAPAEVAGTGATGSVSYQITPGVSGPFPIKGYGLAAGAAQNGNVTSDGANEYPATVGSGAKVAQFSVRTPGTGADVDLYVYQQTAAGRVLVGVSGSSSANETVTLPAPPAGTYIAVVEGFSNAPGTTSTSYVFRSAVVTAGSSIGNFTVTPANPTAVVQRPITVRASWSGVEAGTPYAGFVEYPDGSGTIVTVN